MKSLAAMSNENETRGRFRSAPTIPTKSHPELSAYHPLLQSKTNCPCGGGCPRCQDNLSIQRKTGDVSEQEADHVEQMMKVTNSQAQESRKEEQEIPPKRFASSNAGGDLGVPAIVDDVVRSPGQELDRPSRLLMESRLNQDFSQVRIHTDSKAAESAEAVNALAYAVGRDIVFGNGQYAPQTNAGQRLLAHELTHVSQQSAAGAPAILQRKEKPLHGRSSREAVDYRYEDLIDEALKKSFLWPYIGSKVEKGTKVKGSVTYYPRGKFEEHYVDYHGKTEKAKSEVKKIGGYYEPRSGRIVLPERAAIESMLHEAIHKFEDGMFSGFFGQLQEGVTQHFTNLVLVENGLERGQAYPEETSAARAVADIVGLENLAFAYFLATDIIGVLQQKISHFDVNGFLQEIRRDEVDWQRVMKMMQSS